MNDSKLPTEILLLARTYPPEDIGGVASYCRSVALALAAKGVRVHVLVPRKEKQQDREEGGVKVVAMPAGAGRVLNLFLSLWFFFRYQRKHGIPIVLVGYWIPMGIVAWAASYLLKFRYGTFIYGADIWGYPSRWERWLLRKCCQRSEHLLTITKYTEDEIRAALPGKHRISLIPCTVDPEEMETHRIPAGEDPKAKFDLAGKRVILTASFLGFRKGHRLVLEAMAPLVKEYPDLVYVYTGRGPAQQAIEEKVRELGLENQVQAMGFVDYPTLMHLYQAADVFAMVSYNPDNPADFEGFGIVYLEAGYWKVPSIAARFGGPAEVVVDGTTGRLVEPTNTEQLTEALREMLNDPEKANRIGEAAHQRVMETFTPPVMAESILKVFGL